ncbi:MAG: Positive regulator of CheA protein activity (CheW) [Firmicutes bacterium]|nr:Positive regulator of CheA protein activity (CheW) [Bacillota bacterium]MDI6705763.1 chemotaxis protein CheW [Bacillota bacterium]
MAEKQYVVFKLIDGEYGIEIMQVKEIIKYQRTVKIPDAPDFIEGVINYRDSTTPVIDLAKRFNVGEKEKTDSSRIIVTNINSRHIGFVVDSVEEVLKISKESIDTVPEIMGGIDKQYINGVGKLGERLVILLNVNEVLSSTEKSRLEAIDNNQHV